MAEEQRKPHEDVITTGDQARRRPAPQVAAKSESNTQSIAQKGDAVIVKLGRPHMVGGVEVNQLTVRRPKVRDMLAIDKPGVGVFTGQAALVTQLTNCAPGELDEMDLADFQKLSEAVNDFLGTPPSPTR